MKLGTLTCVTSIFAMLTILVPLGAQNQPEKNPGHVRYIVKELPTLGGTVSNGFGGVNNRGWVTGDANLAGDQTEHGFLWRDGVMTDLGTLGGLNSSVSFPVKDDRGSITGVAQTATFDPLGEFWGAAFFCTTMNCAGFENLEVGFLWQDGVMTALPTLGGNNGAAQGVNNRGQVVGVAETAIQDSTCASPQKLDFEAVIWGPKPHQIQVLPPFPGDSVAAALAINEKGQVVGISGVCQVPSGSFAFGVHAVLWQHGNVTELAGPPLRGTMSNAANAINNQGQVVGQSNLPDDRATHAFFWENGVFTDLGTLPGDTISTANDINNRGQVVGNSCDVNFNCRTFLWENGIMTDLGTLIPHGSPLQLTFASGINDRGEIAGSAFDQNTGVSPAFLAVPCDDRHADVEGCHRVDGEAIAIKRPKVGLPENVREQLRKRLRFGGSTH